MEAAHWSETSVAVYQTTRHRIQQLSNLHCHMKCVVYAESEPNVSITFRVDDVVFPSVNALYHKTDL
jgi:hypothetical protein